MHMYNFPVQVGRFALWLGLKFDTRLVNTVTERPLQQLFCTLHSSRLTGLKLHANTTSTVKALPLRIARPSPTSIRANTWSRCSQTYLLRGSLGLLMQPALNCRKSDRAWDHPCRRRMCLSRVRHARVPMLNR